MLCYAMHRKEPIRFDIISLQTTEGGAAHNIHQKIIEISLSTLSLGMFSYSRINEARLLLGTPFQT